MRSPRVHLVLRAAVVTVSVGALVACSGGSGSSTPTQPMLGPTASSSAIIAGQVSSPTGPASGVKVRVDGSAASVTTDAAGRFQLGGVPTGDRVLTFETQQASPAVTIPQVQASEKISLAVSLSGSSAQIDSMTRSSDSGTTEEVPPPPPATTPLTMSLSPSSWQMCSSKNKGNLNLFVRGTGYDLIDPTSLMLSGDDPAVTPLVPSSAKVQGDHLKAVFSRQAAFGLLLAPVVSGEVRTLTLDYFDTAGIAGQLTADVKISVCGG